MNPEDTFLKLRVGHLQQRKDAINERINSFDLSFDLTNISEYQELSSELLSIHSEMIRIYREELEHINKDIENAE